MINKASCIASLMALCLIPSIVLAESARENPARVEAWNKFADDLLKVHHHYLKSRKVTSKQSIGGYSGMPAFYREISTYDATNGNLLSRIRWEKEHPDRAHVIEIFAYDRTGNLSHDFTAAYLPEYRNSPFQTLINFHLHNGRLQAFRQFDASGSRIYEQCKGSWFDKPVYISVDEPLVGTPDKLLKSEAYIACFGFMPVSAGKYLRPVKALLDQKSNRIENVEIDANASMQIAKYSLRIKFSPNRPELYLKRADAHFALLNFDKAVVDYTKAIDLDDGLDTAYFGRGMAQGRRGNINEGIADLTEFISRNPTHSVAYTKRGVRYIWKGDMENAKKDLERAIELNIKNAEAHDDLGVVFAHRRDYQKAISQFLTTIKLEPDYQKAHHNLALVYQILGHHKRALAAIDSALNIGLDTQTSLLLKGAILESMGRHEEARAFKDSAEYAPTKNSTELLKLR